MDQITSLVHDAFYWIKSHGEITIGQWDSEWTQGRMGGCFWAIGSDAPCYCEPEDILGAVCIMVHNFDGKGLHEV